MTDNDRKPELSIARLALFAMGAATVILGVTTVVIAVVRPGPVVGLIIVAVGIVAAIAAMGAVSHRLVRASLDDSPDKNDPTDPVGGER